MRTRLQTRWLLAAAVAAIPAWGFTTPAQAQFRVGQDGHANDASNRVGSGGLNDTVSNPSLVTGNEIVTGNVTGGRQFRGFVPYSDPLAFRGATAGRGVDDFIRQSSGTPTQASPAFSLDQPRAFYGDSRTVAPPIGTVQEGSTGSYVGTGFTPANPNLSFLTEPAYLNQRLGEATIVGSNVGTTTLALPDNTSQTGFSDQSLLAGSNPNAVVNGPADQSASAYLTDRYAALRGNQAIPNQLDSATIAQMRQELQSAGAADANNGALSADQLDNGVAQPGAPGTKNPNDQRTQSSNRLPAPLESPEGQALSNEQLNSKPLNAGPLGSDPSGNQNMVPADRQSTQYAELQRRMERYQQTHPMTDAERAQALRLQKMRGKNQKAGAQTRPFSGAVIPNLSTRPAQIDGRTGPVNGRPAPEAAPAEKGNAEPAGPVHIESLAAGIKAKGLHDLMAGAEDLMHEDKFASAIVKYNEAERVAPNNSLIPLGRAHAELGAGYYGKAEKDLRRVVGNDPALLMGQFDFKHVLSEQRLAFLQKDLKDLAENDVRSARPWFLLAYLSYNTGDAQSAAKYLAEAQKRSPQNDPVLHLMQTHWSLPAVPATAPDLNK